MQISVADNWILLASLHCTQTKSAGKNLSYRDLLQLKQANLYRASSLSWCGSSCCKQNRCLIWLRRKKHNKSPQSCCLCSQRRSAGPNIWYHVLYEDRNTEEGIKLLSSFQACSPLLGAAHSFLPAPRERQLQRAASAARASCCVPGLVQPTWTNLPWHRRHAWAAHLSLLGGLGWLHPLETTPAAQLETTTGSQPQPSCWGCSQQESMRRMISTWKVCMYCPLADLPVPVMTN